MSILGLKVSSEAPLYLLTNLKPFEVNAKNNIINFLNLDFMQELVITQTLGGAIQVWDLMESFSLNFILLNQPHFEIDSIFP